jgi:2'-5' RNA ligase
MLYLKAKPSITIPDAVLHEYGKEIEPHVTVIYGLHHYDGIEQKLKSLIKPEHLCSVTFKNIGFFNNPEFDVLKLGGVPVTCPLYNLNKIVKGAGFKLTERFPDYDPHMTLAYLLPANRQDVKKFNVTYEPTHFVYSYNGIQTKL